MASMPAPFVIRPAVEEDLADIAAIYEHEIANSIATFDLEPPDSSYWHEKLAGNHPGDHLLVAVDEDEDVVGYAYSWSFRPRGLQPDRETSICLTLGAQGRRPFHPRCWTPWLLRRAHRGGLVALPNPAASTHEAAVRSGRPDAGGRLPDQWIDVLFQKMLNPAHASWQLIHRGLTGPKAFRHACGVGR
jgi:phosphinothricin acetyltransferase